MAETAMIYQTINNVMSEIGAVGKNKRNQQQGFMYRGVDDVMNALNPAFIKHKLFIVPEVLEQLREERTTKNGSGLIYSVCKIRYTFYAADGSNVQVVVIGEGMDSGDKATNKAMAIAFKYACFQLFCIPTEEMTDPDADAHAPEPKGAAKEKKAASAEPKKQKETLPPTNPGTEPPTAQLVTQPMMTSIQSLVEKYSSMGLKLEKILKMYKIKDLAEMSVLQYKDCMKKLELYEKGDKPNE